MRTRAYECSVRVALLLLVGCGSTRAPQMSESDLACSIVENFACREAPEGGGFGVLFGRLVDANGAPIHKATISATRPTDPDLRAASWTTPVGDYAITLLPVGRYNVEVSYLSGHLAIACVAIDAARVTHLDIAMPTVELQRAARCSGVPAPSDREREIAAMRANGVAAKQRIIDNAKAETCALPFVSKTDAPLAKLDRAKEFADVVAAVRSVEQVESAADLCHKDFKRLE
jgi:hypothetical protein